MTNPLIKSNEASGVPYPLLTLITLFRASASSARAKFCCECGSKNLLHPLGDNCAQCGACLALIGLSPSISEVRSLGPALPSPASASKQGELYTDQSVLSVTLDEGYDGHADLILNLDNR